MKNIRRFRNRKNAYIAACGIVDEQLRESHVLHPIICNGFLNRLTENLGGDPRAGRALSYLRGVADTLGALEQQERCEAVHEAIRQIQEKLGDAQ